MSRSPTPLATKLGAPSWTVATPIIDHPEASAEFDAAAERYESLSVGLGESFVDEVEALVTRRRSPRSITRLPVLDAMAIEWTPTTLLRAPLAVACAPARVCEEAQTKRCL